MDFALDPEQQALQRSLRAFLADHAPETAVRAQLDDPIGHDRALWRRMSDDLGLPGLAIPEAYGGSGFGFVELGLALEEMGRALTVSPFVASAVMAAQLLLASDDEAAKGDLLPSIASGEVVATVAMAEAAGSWDPARVTATAAPSGGGWTVSGTKEYVLDGAAADLLLVVARHHDDLVVVAVDGSASAVTRAPVTTLDLTRKEATVVFADAPGRLVATGRGPVDRMLDRTAIALAAEALGGTDAVLASAVAYAKVREQFGRPIGSFQAVKHQCASMLVELEASRSAVWYALWAAGSGSPEEPALASMVKAFCTDTYVDAAAQSLHIHGGIGFTWEHPAHLHLKRAKNLQLFLGGPDRHRALVADRTGV